MVPSPSSCNSVLWSHLLTSLTEFPTHKGASNSVVASNECGQVEVEQCLILHTHPSINHAQIHLWWMTKDKRGQWIVRNTSRESQCIEPIADKVCRHTWGEEANSITSEDSCATSRC